MVLKIDNGFKPTETSAPKAKKSEKVSISFSDLLSGKKVYTLPSLGETKFSSGPDSVTISESSKIANYLLKIKSMMANIPDIREEKIKNAIELLKEIDNKEITKKIVERML